MQKGHFGRSNATQHADKVTLGEETDALRRTGVAHHTNFPHAKVMCCPAASVILAQIVRLEQEDGIQIMQLLAI